MANKDFPLSITIEAIDKTTAKFRAINDRVDRLTAPVRKLTHSFSALSKESGLTGIGSGIANVGKTAFAAGKEITAFTTKFALLGLGAGYGLYRVTRSIADAGDALDDNSKRLNLSVDEYGSYSYAVSRAGISQEEFDASVQKMNVNLGQLKTRQGALNNLLAKTNPKLLTQLKHTKGSAQAFHLLLEAAEKITDPMKRANFIQTAFGKGSGALNGVAADGIKVFDELTKKYIDLAGSQNEFARNSGPLADSFDDIEKAAKGAFYTFATPIMPVLTEQVQKLTAWISSNSGKFREWGEYIAKRLPVWIEQAKVGLSDLAKSIAKISDNVAEVVKTFGGWGNAAIALGVVIASGPVLAVLSLTKALGALSIAWLKSPLGRAALFTTAAYALGGKINKAIGVDDEHTLLKRIANNDWDFSKTGFNLLAQPLPVQKPAAAAGKSVTNNATVKIDMTGVHRATKITTPGNNTAALDLNVGYANGASSGW